MIAVNETGYLPDEIKIATADFRSEFRVKDLTDDRYADCNVKVEECGYDECAGSEIFRIDFSELRAPGLYCIESDDKRRSCSFKIEKHVYRTLKNAMIKALYFQRCGMALEKKYAGPYVHVACHCGESRLFGDDKSKASICGGWHDAGDFGRYVTPAAAAVAHLLYAYELFPDAFGESINIPESGNGIPDVLNECRYELDWIMQMQADDGGVYHKQTTMRHADFIMPENDNNEMYIFPVSSLATADFAAVMCLASRIYEKIDPLFARDAVHAAQAAGQWLLEHPDNTDFRNPEGSNTGEYNDDDDTDERLWAFCELAGTDYEIKNENDHSMMSGMPQKMSRHKIYAGQAERLFEKYLKKTVHADNRTLDDGFGWSDVSSFAMTAVIFDKKNILGESLKKRMTDTLVGKAEVLLKMQEGRGSHVAMSAADYVWGSNMVVSNRGILFICAALALKEEAETDPDTMGTSETANIKVVEYTVIGKNKAPSMNDEDRNILLMKASAFEKAALEQLHYICGRNAADVSYVTGFGEHAFMHPHNRTCSADGIERPIPGEVSGGPCHPPVDETARNLVPEGAAPEKCYADDERCYSLNEIAIYWNTSAAFVAAYFDR